MSKCRLTNFVPFCCPQSIFYGVISALSRFGLSCYIVCGGGYMCVYNMYVFLIFYLGQLYFCLNPFLFFNYVYSISYRELILILEATFPVQVYRHFSLFLCCLFISLNRTYILFCLFCLFTLKSGKVQQGQRQSRTFVCCRAHCQHECQRAGRRTCEAPTQFSVPKRYSSSVSLLEKHGFFSCRCFLLF